MVFLIECIAYHCGCLSAYLKLSSNVSSTHTHASMAEGAVSNELRGTGNPHYLPNGDPGVYGGGTYTGVGRDPTIEDYENIFGPAARDIKQDPERNRRRQRWHLPDALQGSNPWLADRIDGLITDTTSSPFTTIILPYKHIDNVDGKIKWNVWSFDEGMASRVPYESSARVLTQTKRSFAGYTVRQGLAIVMEANFMMSPAGQENFRNQVQQVVHSIQYTNNLDVHVALIQAPSYQKHVDERYWNQSKSTAQQIRDYIDMFGFVQKNPNALDIAIEEAKEILRSWGAKDPTFMLCNSKLTMQLTMTPERTQYFTQGYDGIRRLKDGPNINKYRGLSVIHSHSFSVETGSRPRDLLTRRVRVGEYYRIHSCPPLSEQQYQLYDESRDTWFTLCMDDLIKHSLTPGRQKIGFALREYGWQQADDGDGDDFQITNYAHGMYKDLYDYCRGVAGERALNDYNPINNGQLRQFVDVQRALIGSSGTQASFQGSVRNALFRDANLYNRAIEEIARIVARCGQSMDTGRIFARKYAAIIFNAFEAFPKNRLNSALLRFSVALSQILDDKDKHLEFVLLRPNIEHNMYGVILGRGGHEDLGSTLWGQTQLECYSDSVHGIWGMSYKYNERAIVFNEKNLIRLWDIAYASYSGGKDSRILDWRNEEAIEEFIESTSKINAPYTAQSLLVMAFDRGLKTKSFTDNWSSPIAMLRPTAPVPMHPDNNVNVNDEMVPAALRDDVLPPEYERVLKVISDLHTATKTAGESSHENLAAVYGSMYFQGSIRTLDCSGRMCSEVHGSGHHGPDYVGVASKRNGKGMATSRGPTMGIYAAT